MQAAGASLSLTVEVVRAQSPSEFTRAFDAMAKSRVDSVVVTEDGEFAGQTETCTPYRHTKCGSICA